ncbi:alpha-beta hydrolase superfamily lysophospholipase [Aeromicrobium panaciterrae]|uniref:Alpha-beta hydrolase superfamily lysophospholipase n=1 Tax=Aeromicrobium panaciterrae TaxID=363861 RepID=A0ABU1UQQ9_9ACTN|nr:alpha/beta hydrolase [Aeromicrobium panaciterrae]MDR7087519.1 alpha-beta hydrolase superfamily lysophospholipase [Aeromicrobium panaciterrae]
MPSLSRIASAAMCSLALVVTAAPAHAAAPKPGTPEYLARDLTNIANAYGRITGPGGQLANPAYLPALVKESNATAVAQLLAQAATPTRLALTAAMVVPGWNVGNPLRASWNGTRGVITPVTFTNRYGALLRGDVFSPKPGAKDPYTGASLKGPFPGVVLTPGSVQGSQGMYRWLAEDLAERGYVVLAYDVQGQGTSETLPHQTGNTFPFCNPLSEPEPTEMTGCPGFPFQQSSNFVKGTEDATDFFFSTPTKKYANIGAAGAKVDSFNPLWKQFDRSVDTRTATKGRTTRFAIIGHSLGAFAVSKVQGTDKRVAAVVALDKLQAGGLDVGGGLTDVGPVTPSVPALGIQSEYGFTVSPAALSGGSSLVPAPGDPAPQRERATGFDAWRAKKVDSMVIVPRASTHLEYTDIPLVLPASRYGQALTSVYVQRWLDRYLKHESVKAKPTGTDPLLATSFKYLEPAGNGVWKPTTLKLDGALSFYYCSAYAITDRNGKTKRFNGDIAKVGGCTN